MVTELFGRSSPQPNDPLLEQLIIATAGSYDVIGELGRGGMAVVYEGIDRKLERRVAIKVMDPRLSMTHGMAQRFLQEARIAGRLQHPNIIVVHDVRQSDEIIFFVMSLIDGVGVDELCRQPTPMPIDQVRWILLQATRALAYAHSEHIVHRDIKPANILLNLKGDVILTDFGIAKALGDTGLTQTGTTVGTPVYMSPEQFAGMPVGPASDQYALGITAYQLIAGRPPFSGDLYQLISQHGGRAPDPILDLRPDCRPFLANAVMRMLEKRPEDRWPSLEDLAGVFGASMAMDGGVARRNLAETVRALHQLSPRRGMAGEPLPSTPPSTPRPPETIVVSISPPGATIFVRHVIELRASAAMHTGESLPDANVRWSSSNESILTVQPNGTVTGVAPGHAVVGASVNGVWSEATIHVEAAPIAQLSLTTPHVTMRVGDVLRPDVTAIDVNGAPRDDVSIVWSSRAPAVADLDALGAVRAISPGTAVIDVSTGSIQRSIEVAVLRRVVAVLRLGVASRMLHPGETLRLSLDAFDDLGMRADASSARWTSSAPSIIHVDSTGRALAMAPGVARLTAVIDEATDSVELASLEPAVGSLQLTLPDTQLEFGDDSPVTLLVKDINGASRSAEGVRVWSSDPRVLRVDESGQRLRGVGIGEAVLYAAPEEGDESSAAATSVRVTVTDIAVARIEMSPSTLDIEVGSVSAVNLLGLDRRGRHVSTAVASWMSDAPAIAMVEGSGIVRGLAPGSCRVVASIRNPRGANIESEVAVRVRRASIARLVLASDKNVLDVGERVTMRVTTWDARGAEVAGALIVWRSTDPTIARVEGDGQLVALAPGRATITAELEGKSEQVAIIVAPAPVTSLVVTPQAADAVIGVALPFAIEARDRNGLLASPVVRWSVAPADAATVTSDGRVTPLRAGAIEVRASLAVPTDTTGIPRANRPLDAVASIVARAPRVVAVHFAAPAVTMKLGRTLRADMIARTDAGSVAPSRSLAWVSENPGVVQVDTDGELRAVALGSARVTASADSADASMMVHVVAAGTSPVALRTLALAGGAVVLAGIVWAAWPTTKPAVIGKEVAGNSAPSGTSASAPAVPPATTITASGAPSAAMEAEIPSAKDLRQVADQVVRGVMAGSLRTTAELRQFFADGTEHKAAVVSAPAMTEPDQGRVRTKFEMSLTRLNAGGVLERRVSVVRIEVAKRIGGAPDMLSAAFGPIVRPGSR